MAKTKWNLTVLGPSRSFWVLLGLRFVFADLLTAKAAKNKKKQRKCKWENIFANQLGSVSDIGCMWWLMKCQTWTVEGIRFAIFYGYGCTTLCSKLSKKWQVTINFKFMALEDLDMLVEMQVQCGGGVNLIIRPWHVSHHAWRVLNLKCLPQERDHHHPASFTCRNEDFLVS